MNTLTYTWNKIDVLNTILNMFGNSKQTPSILFEFVEDGMYISSMLGKGDSICVRVKIENPHLYTKTKLIKPLEPMSFQTDPIRKLIRDFKQKITQQDKIKMKVQDQTLIFMTKNQENELVVQMEIKAIDDNPDLSDAANDFGGEWLEFPVDIISFKKGIIGNEKVSSVDLHIGSSNEKKNNSGISFIGTDDSMVTLKHNVKISSETKIQLNDFFLVLHFAGCVLNDIKKLLTCILSLCPKKNKKHLSKKRKLEEEQENDEDENENDDENEDALMYLRLLPLRHIKVKDGISFLFDQHNVNVHIYVSTLIDADIDS